VSFTDMRLTGELYLLLWKMCWTSHDKNYRVYQIIKSGSLNTCLFK